VAVKQDPASRLRGTARASIGTKTEGSPRQGVQTVDRALAVLDLFRHEEPEFSLTEIAERLNLHLSTAHRLLATMEAHGYVQRAPRSGHYRLGLKIIEQAGIALNQGDVVRHSLAELDSLRDALNLNVNLAVLFQGDVFHLAYAVRADTPRYYTTIGRRAVAHCTALGQVLLAAQPRAAVHEDIERRGWRPYTVHSIQDGATLDSRLDEVAAQGYAIDRNERSLGTCCLAMPVRSYTNEVVAAMSVTGPSQEFQGEAIDGILATVRERARHLSMKLGYLT